ncbi:hypothetical protein HPB47_005200 [Ixodes persulcatus]|uniref:Uncharacterized protein n=1 Tax=Ixodes persulcatus TaxID=34615 RepID=A0AC60PDU1_IXOPE|nr:hypothetical protein HPB47_005200 [Ixodes persulcatus]
MAQVLAQIHQLVLGGRSYPSYTYLAAPGDCSKGTIHDARPGSTMEELVRCIRTEDGTQIITARILGQFGSALITFADRSLPHHLVDYDSRRRVTPYRPLKQVCTTCMKEGHRADVCPTPSTQACPRCTSPILAPEHGCAPKCRLYDGDHPNGDKVCQHRYADRRPRNQGAGCWSRSRSRSRKPPNKKTPAKADRSESRGRSHMPHGRSRSKTRSRSTERPEDAQQTIARQQELITQLQQTITRLQEMMIHQEEVMTRLQEGLDVQGSEQEVAKRARRAYVLSSAFIASREYPPDVICLQEISRDLLSLSGYQTHTHANPRIAMLLAKRITVKKHHKFDSSSVEHAIVELFPKKRNAPSFFTLNIYSLPSCTKDVFECLLAPALHLAKQNLPVNKFVRKQALTDWDAFRKLRPKQPALSGDLEQWVRDLQTDIEKHTRHVNLANNRPEAGSRLLHLWDGRRGLLKRWKRQQFDRKFKI